MRRLGSFQLFDTFVLKNEQRRLEEITGAQAQRLPFDIEWNRQGTHLLAVAKRISRCSMRLPTILRMIVLPMMERE